MNSQSLSISTIVIIIIAIVVLAAVLLFFFSGMGGTKGSLNGQVDTAKCNTILSQIVGSNPTNNQAVISSAKSLGFCSNNCDKVMHPTIQTQSGSCILTCSNDQPTCS